MRQGLAPVSMRQSGLAAFQRAQCGPAAFEQVGRHLLGRRRELRIAAAVAAAAAAAAARRSPPRPAGPRTIGGSTPGFQYRYISRTMSAKPAES